MLDLVARYSRHRPDNPLRRFLPALRRVNGTASHAGLGRPFERAWAQAARDPDFGRTQDLEHDRLCFDPAVRRGKADRLSTLGQFVYYDALVMHGPGNGSESFGGIRAAARRRAATPADGGDETAYLRAFFTARKRVIRGSSRRTPTPPASTPRRRGSSTSATSTWRRHCAGTSTATPTGSTAPETPGDREEGDP